MVFYLTSGHFVIEHDGIRGSNQHYSRMVDIVMLDFTKRMITNNRLQLIDTGCLQTRVDTIIRETQKQQQKIQQLKQGVTQ